MNPAGLPRARAGGQERTINTAMCECVCAYACRYAACMPDVNDSNASVSCPLITEPPAAGLHLNVYGM